MASSQDTEITLGTAKLLGLFFGLVMVCAVFFALGYTLGRKADVGLAANSPAAVPLPATLGNSKPANSAPSQMTFYKAVEQQNANPQLTPASADAGSVGGNASQASAGQTATSPGATGAVSPSGNQAQAAQNGNAPDAMVAIPGPGYFVQVAAVSKQDDADALVDALKKKEYPAFVANNAATDKLFRVQVGPFADIKDAEAMRSRLVNDGYNPILKK
ncbi:MAG: SPOR domain-containing protein [Candidatus Sulfotelmatobacter sp.]